MANDAFQPWVTYFGVPDQQGWSNGLIQPPEGWIDTADTVRVGIEVRTLCVTHCTLHIETIVDPLQDDSSWSTICAITQAGNTKVLAEATSGASPMLYRWLRWRVEEEGGVAPEPWTVCFRAEVVAK